MRLYALLIFLLVPQALWANHPIEDFLKSSLVSTSTEATPDSIEIFFPQSATDNDTNRNQKFYVTKEILKKSLLESTLALEKLNKQNQEHGSVLNPMNWPKLVSDFVESLPKRVVIVHVATKSMVKEYGYLPVAVLVTTVAITYPVYTFATEIVESMFLGPAHVFCQLFQVLYFAGLKKVLNEMDRAQKIFYFTRASYKEKLPLLTLLGNARDWKTARNNQAEALDKILLNWQSVLNQWFTQEQIAEEDFRTLSQKLSEIRIQNKRQQQQTVVAITKAQGRILLCRKVF